MDQFEPDESLLMALKKLELTANQMQIGLPFPGSDLFSVLGIEEWKMRLLCQVANEVATKAKSAHLIEWMKGKE